jgi:pilus assembly protein Flp/PilA
MKDYVEEKALGAWVWLKSEKGQGLIEYALIIALIIIIVIALLSVIGQQVNNIYSNINNALP